MEKEQGTTRFAGTVLLCEDNEINQHYIKSQFNRLGLSVVMANDGREGVEEVRRRMQTREAPFDLIFMDIQMPVMDGLEAADQISGQGVKTPIIALTANVTPEDQALHARHGMHRSLCKPFSPEALLACLSEYLKPAGSQKINTADRLAEDEKQRRKLFTSFVKRNQNTYQEICDALDAGDVKLAHRLAHTLRGLAGLMGKKTLAESARVVEHALANGDAAALDKQALTAMGEALRTVLAELAPYLDEPRQEAPVNWDRDAARVLFDALEPLLAGDNAASQQYLDALRAIPGTSDLVAQIETYEFESAVVALSDLRKTLAV